MPIYLLIMTHKITGLKYLCKTTQNIEKYFGSGLDWKEHLLKFGKNVEKTVLKICTSKEELRYWGLYYSRLFNIVGAMDDFGNKIWANKIPESGGGPGWKSGSENPIKNIDVYNKMCATLNSPYHKEKRSGKNNAMTRPDVKGKMAKIRSTEEHKEKFKLAMIKVNARPDIKEKQKERSSGLNNKWANKKKYYFIDKNGNIENCTQIELRTKHDLSATQLSMVVNGFCKSVKGWKLLQS